MFCQPRPELCTRACTHMPNGASQLWNVMSFRPRLWLYITEDLLCWIFTEAFFLGPISSRLKVSQHDPPPLHIHSLVNYVFTSFISSFFYSWHCMLCTKQPLLLLLLELNSGTHLGQAEPVRSLGWSSIHSIRCQTKWRWASLSSSHSLTYRLFGQMKVDLLV